MCYQPIERKVRLSPFGDKTGYRFVNCRQCLECRQSRANEWALRCMMEAKNWPMTCFITLTYETSPVWLKYDDFQDFMKRLRRHLDYKYGIKIKMFMCGEYGSLNYRPHFHALIFGYDFSHDKWLKEKSPKGYNIYDSDTLTRLWGHGLVTIQDLTLNSCAYCALYSSKPKNTLPAHLRHAPEFNEMSKGLGIPEIMKHMEVYLETDEIWFDGRKHNIPQIALNKYFADKGGDMNHKYVILKSNRVEKAKQSTKAHIAQRTYCHYAEKRYRAENKQKRLSKPLE